jgi:hypothetical protein
MNCTNTCQLSENGKGNDVDEGGRARIALYYTPPLMASERFNSPVDIAGTHCTARCK